MILTKLAIENFGLYSGRTTFNLAPSVDANGARRPVVLVGGQNGSGKTTFLEALRIALYGSRALGIRVGRSEYEAFVAQRAHRGADGTSAPSAAVEVDFDYSEAGTVHRYGVRREWSFGGGRTRETLRLEKDGKPVEAVPPDEWHHFLQELIPPGVSQLFFFDGEKIQDIADSDDDGGQIVEAIRSLLGIELITSLRTDLGLYLARHRRAANRGSHEGSVQETKLRIEALQAEIEGLVGDVAELRTLLEGQARTAEQARRRFNQEGGEIAARRATLEAEREDVRRRLARAEASLRDLAGGLLPFALAPRLMARLAARADRALTEASVDRSATAESTAALRATLASWRAGEVGSPRRARWTELHWRDLDELLNAPTAGTNVEGGSFQPAGALPRDAVELRALRDRLLEVRVATLPRAAEVGRDIEDLARALDRTENLIGRANGAANSILLDELNGAERQTQGTAARLKAAEDQLHQSRVTLAQAEKRRSQALDEENTLATKERQTALAGRVGAALADYEGRLMRLKVGRLEREFVSCFRALARKSDLLERVEIDGTTFDVRLFARQGGEIGKSSLSAGERQIYAISMLWALARTSGRALPAIIDTPLARLDRAHRSRLVERYFPFASHQTILLSTDTEVETDLLDKLRPHISHSYRLEYEPTLGRTIVHDGYFELAPPTGDRGQVRALRQA